MEMAIIYGAITLHKDYVNSVDFIRSLGPDLMFPAINTSDFGLGDYNNYHHEGRLMYDYSWDNMVISYAHTTGAAILHDLNLKIFTLKFEHVLRNVDFVQATIHMQSAESLENISLFWEKREHRYFDTSEDLVDEVLIETDEWNFGYGMRTLNGYLKEPVEHVRTITNHHPYPMQFSEEFSWIFFDLTTDLMQKYGAKGIPRPEFEKNLFLSPIELRGMISYLQFKKVISVENDGAGEMVNVIAPELLRAEYLYK